MDLYSIKKINDIKGFGITADQKINKNTIIVIEKAQEISLMSSVCSYCINKIKECIKCSSCNMVYCSTICKKLDFEIHKKLCENYMDSDDSDDSCDLYVKMIYDIIIKSTDMSSYAKTFNMSNEDKIKYKKYIDKYPQWIEIYEKIKTNVYALSSPCLKIMYGIGLFKISSYINHSCNPNCILWTIKDTIYFKTIRDIDKDEELCDSYIYGVSCCDKQHRAKILFGQFGIKHCLCQRCETNNDIHLDTTENNTQLLQSYDMCIKKLFSNRNFTDAFNLCNKYKKALEFIRNKNIYVNNLLAYILFIKVACAIELNVINVKEFMRDAKEMSFCIFNSYTPLTIDFGCVID